jgi:hypothetical protein
MVMLSMCKSSVINEDFAGPDLDASEVRGGELRHFDNLNHNCNPISIIAFESCPLSGVRTYCARVSLRLRDGVLLHVLGLRIHAAV